MTLFCSSLRRAVIAGVLSLALAGCAAQEAMPSALVLSGGGTVSSDQGTSVLEKPESSSSQESESSKSEAPSFQELPSSEDSSQSGEAAPPESSSEASSSEEVSSSSSEMPSSSEAPASSSAPSSYAAPLPSSSQADEEDEEDPPEDDEDDGDDWEDEDPEENNPDEDDPDEAPEKENLGQNEPDQDEPDEPDEEEPDEEDPDEEEPDEDESDSQSGYSGSSGWEDLKVRNNGSTISDSAVSIVSRMVQNEVNSSFPAEAIKAQAVAAYTFVRYHNTVEGDIPSVGMTSAGGVSDRIAQLVREVAGEQITYNGRPILATYCAGSAGVTTSAQSVWGSSLPYLVPVKSEGDKSTAYYGATSAMSASDVRSRLERYFDINLSGVSPKDWFDILSYWDGGPYVNKVSIAGRKETNGRVLRESVLGLRSAAFEVKYDKENDRFIFTTYGYGHGVGMSQMGAKYYAEQGWSYVDILEHYYSGTTVE